MAKKILLADDSVTIQKVVELTFMDEDYEVVAVSDGEAALERVGEVDLVIADVHMPGADGYEVCRRVKESRPGLPVLLLVGTFEPFDEAKAAAARADGHLKKPFDSQELLSQVESLISGAGTPAAGVPATEVPTAEIPLSDLRQPPVTAKTPMADLFPSDEPPPAADLEPPPLDAEAADLEPPPLDAGASASAPPDGSEETRPTAARSAEVAPPEVAAPEELEAPELEEVEPEVTEPEEAAPEAAAPEEPEAAAPEEPEAAPAAATEAGNGALSDRDVERIARRVAELVGEKTLREVAWEVVPDLAEVIIKERIRELESQVE